MATLEYEQHMKQVSVLWKSTQGQSVKKSGLKEKQQECLKENLTQLWEEIDKKDKHHLRCENQITRYPREGLYYQKFSEGKKD